MNVERSSRPRLCLVGTMVGRNPGYIPTQDQRLADLLEAAGHPVVAVSSRSDRYRRLVEILATILRERRTADMLLVFVYSGLGFLMADVATLLGRACRLPMVLSLHGGGLPELVGEHPGWARRVLARGHVVVTPSEYLARAVRSLGFDVTIIPNVLDEVPYRHRTRTAVRPALVWMRAFHEVYDPETAVRVFASLRARLPQASLTMAGPDKGRRDRVERLAAQLRAPVRFCGFLKREAKERELEAADIFLNTSRVDNQPLSLIEACAMGLVVVSTDAGGIPDLLTHERSALLVARGDVRAMASAVERLVERPALAAQLSRAGQEIGARSVPQVVVPQWQALFAELVARGAS